MNVRTQKSMFVVAAIDDHFLFELRGRVTTPCWSGHTMNLNGAPTHDVHVEDTDITKKTSSVTTQSIRIAVLIVSATVDH